MSIRLIRTEDDYQAALKAVEPFFENEPEPESEDGEQFEIMLTLIEAYERKHYQLPLPDPIEAIKFRMEQEGLSIADMKAYLGNPNRVYEVLNRKRGLSLAMIRRLHRGLHIPAEVLIGE
ncbi:transcriptional regulator [Paludibacterium sp.]|uniref:helix-turn-helix domain-containing protein n=1 Tax=Paludibacterium sp. TaxID=1917523 RepID=UPI0025D42465|nr:transcriptional regulator [Paludibacterium sp.]MBV8647819.1 transcriptional regulator [Paludibacterium sp.]